MFPILFQYKFITIAGYGVLLGIAFYTAFLFLERELKLAGKDPELAYKIILTVIPTAIVGAKLFHVIENFKEFTMDPMGMIFSGSGLSVQGGFFLAFIACIYLIRQNNESVLEIFDIVSPPMALGYAIGRLACHVAGDGCYGIKTTSIFGTPYPNGIVPTSIDVLPTPLFESLISFLIIILLLQLRKREFTPGKIFFIYIMLRGLPRFSIEFVRLNPKVVFGITQAQIVALLFFITGLVGFIFVHKRAQQQKI